MPNDYYTNPKYRFFPVVGITHEQAVAFCEWRTEIVTEKFNKEKGYKNTDKDYTIFKFRLPTQDEWEKCAGYGLDTDKYPHGFKTLKRPIKFTKKAAEYLHGNTINSISKDDLSLEIDSFNKNQKEDYVINCKRPVDTFLNLKTPFNVWAYPKNQFGIYNMLGNVAEMTFNKGEAKGGSWLDQLEYCKISSIKTYNNRNYDVGFRTVCVLEWPNKSGR